jgi:hypothetical protein
MGESNYHHTSTVATNLVAAALAYAARGWHVLPCNPANKRPLTMHGFEDATTNPAQITAWWQEWPYALIGVRTGPQSGLWVLDVDVYPADGIDGFAAIAALEKQHGTLPDTLCSTTPRGDGGYVIMPPSMRHDRKTYSWHENCPAEPAEAPTWLIELLMTPPAGATRNSNGRGTCASTSNGYARAALTREIVAVAGALVGQRNHALNRASFNLHQLVASGALSESEVQGTGVGKLPCCACAAPTLKSSASAMQHKSATRDILVAVRDNATKARDAKLARLWRSRCDGDHKNALHRAVTGGVGRRLGHASGGRRYLAG